MNHMPFGIEFLPPETPASGPGLAVGRITVGTDFSEKFETDLSYWDRSRYEEDWRTNVRRLVEGAERAVLLTSITAPASANFFFWWPLYRDGETVHVQNQLLFLDELSSPFDPARSWDFVADRETVNEDGLRISEWQCSLSDLRSWLNA